MVLFSNSPLHGLRWWRDLKEGEEECITSATHIFQTYLSMLVDLVHTSSTSGAWEDFFSRGADMLSFTLYVGCFPPFLKELCKLLVLMFYRVTHRSVVNIFMNWYKLVPELRLSTFHVVWPRVASRHKTQLALARTLCICYPYLLYSLFALELAWKKERSFCVILLMNICVLPLEQVTRCFPRAFRPTIILGWLSPKVQKFTGAPAPTAPPFPTPVYLLTILPKYMPPLNKHMPHLDAGYNRWCIVNKYVHALKGRYVYNENKDLTVTYEVSQQKVTIPQV